MTSPSISCPRGIELSKVSPSFLHANSTSHTWAFSAFAEIIDNAYDPDVCASDLLIDIIEIDGKICIIFLDNGAGMDTNSLVKMLSFGFCDKQMYDGASSHRPIGQYGNGFKSGTMRLAKDALVFTRCRTSASIGFLSQTYLNAIGADSVFIPILTYRLPKLERFKSEHSRNNLNAILKYSVFSTEQELKDELFALEGSMTGTKIILSNLRRLQDGKLELDFSSEEHDIRCPEAHEIDLTSVYHRPVQMQTSEYKHSLREYCSILFLKPRMKITIRGKRVKSKLISKSLSHTETDIYKPTWLAKPLKITFGFTCKKTQTDDYGMMLYHRNRLIKAFEKVGYQKQPNDLGIGVVGVAQVDCLQATHNKQDFIKDEKFNSIIAAFGSKLNDYWNEKKQVENSISTVPNERTAPDWLWAQCDQCLKWRRMPDGFDSNSLPEHWFCRLNSDPTHNRCEIPEEPEDEDLAVKASYIKTFKRKKEEQKRQEMIHSMKQQGSSQHNSDSKGGITLAPRVMDQELKRELDEAKEREEQQRQLILKIQKEKRLMEERLMEWTEGLKGVKGKNRKNIIDQDLVTQKIMESISELSGASPRLGQETQKRKLQISQDEGPNKRGRNIDSGVKQSPSNAHTPLRINDGGIVNKEKNIVSKKKKSFKSISSNSHSKGVNSKTTNVSKDNIEYEVEVNDDYVSDADNEPDEGDLKRTRQRDNDIKRANETKEEEDMKPDMNAIDKRIEPKKLEGEQSVAKNTLQAVKQEVLDNEYSHTDAVAGKENTSSLTADSDKIPSSEAVSYNSKKLLVDYLKKKSFIQDDENMIYDSREEIYTKEKACLNDKDEEINDNNMNECEDFDEMICEERIDSTKQKEESDAVSKNSEANEVVGKFNERLEVKNRDGQGNPLELHHKKGIFEIEGSNEQSKNCEKDDSNSSGKNGSQLSQNSVPHADIEPDANSEDYTPSSPTSGQQSSEASDNKECQTDPSLLDDVIDKVKNEHLEETRQRFNTFIGDVHHLLGLLCPTVNIGDVQDTIQTVREMIHVHLEGSHSQSQEDNDQL